jgi:hypothetical protein
MKKLLPIIFMALCSQLAIAQPNWTRISNSPIPIGSGLSGVGYGYSSATGHLSDLSPVAAYSASNGTSSFVIVQYFDQSSYRWVEFGSNPEPSSPDPAYTIGNNSARLDIKMAIHPTNDDVYLAIYDQPTGNIVVRQFNGTSWSTLYTAIAASTLANTVSFDLKLSPSNVPHLLYNTSSPAGIVLVNCTNGVTINGNIATFEEGFGLTLTFMSTGDPVVAYGVSGVMNIKRLSAGVWTSVGTSGILNPNFSFNGLYIDEIGSNLVLAYVNNLNNLVTLQSPFSGSWTSFGTTTSSVSGTNRIFSACENGTGGLYIAYINSSGLGEVINVSNVSTGVLHNPSFTVSISSNISISKTETLQYPAVTTFSSGTYSLYQPCQNIAPTITIPPTSIGALCVGQSAVFNANGTGVNTTIGPVLFAWEESGNIVGTTPTLTIPNVVAGDVGRNFILQLRDHCGLETSSTPVSITGPISAITLNAGADLDVCAGASVGISANISGGTPSYSHNWSSISGGTLNSVSTLTPLFTAGTIAGVNTLTLTSIDNNGCTATDNVQVTVLPIPLVNAGADQSLCITSGALNLSGSSTGTSFLWSGGSGTYTNNTLLNPQYIPSASDYTLGLVTFTLTGINGPCLNTDAVTFTIEEAPILDAGLALSVCATSTPNVPLIGSILQGSPTTFWSTSGAGTIANASNPSTIYTFTTPERSGGGGTIVFTLNASPGAICPATSDAFVVTYEGTPTLNAGTDLTICNDRIELSTASTTPTKGVTWSSSSATGVFIPSDGLLNPTYLLQADDISNGFVTLSLNSIPGICPAINDNIVVTINNASIPTINAGSDQVISTTNATINGVLSGAGTLSWSSTGTGSFTAANSATPIYTFSAEDQNEGMVAVFAKVIGNAPCENYFDLDTLILRFDSPNSISGTIARANARMVLLKKLNGFFEPVNIITAAANGSYTFDKVGSGEFLVYYFDENNRAVYNGSVTDWKAASPIVISTGSSTVNISALTDITLAPSIIAQYLSGDDRIVGTILLNLSSLSFVSARTADAGDEKPLQDATVYLLTEDGTRLGSTTTDANGTYSFSGLNGETYSIEVEYPSTVYDVPPASTVTLDGDDVTVDAVNAAMIKSRASSTQSGANSAMSYHNVSLYPNPAQNYVELKGVNAEEVTELVWMDVSGQIVFKSEFTKLSAQSISVSVPNLEMGTYILKWKEAGLSYSAPVVISK